MISHNIYVDVLLIGVSVLGLITESLSWIYESSSLECQGAYSEYCFNGPNSADDYRTYDDAMLWCQNRSSQLAVISNSETQDAVSTFLDSWNSSSTNLVYINMKLRMATVWTWYLINGSSFNGGLVNQNSTLYYVYSSLQFSLTQPQSAFGSGSQSEAWWSFGSRPDVPRQYICEFIGSSCSTMNNSFLYNGRCYVKYETDSVNWFEARKRCISNGGDLATFNYPTIVSTTEGWQPPFDNSTLNRSLSYWVGIRYNNLSWMSPGDSQNESMFYNWSSGKPNNFFYSCVCLDPNAIPRWSWTDCDCKVKRQFLCLTRIQTTTVKATNTTTISQIFLANTTTQPTLAGLGIGIGIGVGISVFVFIVVIAIAVFILKQRQKRSSDAAATIDGNQSQSTKMTSGDHRHTLQPPSPADYEGLKSEQGGTEARAYDRLNQEGTLEYEEPAGATQK